MSVGIILPPCAGGSNYGDLYREYLSACANADVRARQSDGGVGSGGAVGGGVDTAAASIIGVLAAAFGVQCCVGPAMVSVGEGVEGLDARYDRCETVCSRVSGAGVGARGLVVPGVASDSRDGIARDVALEQHSQSGVKSEVRGVSNRRRLRRLKARNAKAAGGVVQGGGNVDVRSVTEPESPPVGELATELDKSWKERRLLENKLAILRIGQQVRSWDTSEAGYQERLKTKTAQAEYRRSVLGQRMSKVAKAAGGKAGKDKDVVSALNRDAKHEGTSRVGSSLASVSVRSSVSQLSDKIRIHPSIPQVDCDVCYAPPRPFSPEDLPAYRERCRLVKLLECDHPKCDPPPVEEPYIDWY